MVSKVWGRRHLPTLHTRWQMHTHHLSSSYRVVFSSTRVLHSTYFRKHCDYLCCVFSMKYFQEKIFFLIRRNSKKKKSSFESMQFPRFLQKWPPFQRSVVSPLLQAPPHHLFSRKKMWGRKWGHCAHVHSHPRTCLLPACSLLWGAD